MAYTAAVRWPWIDPLPVRAHPIDALIPFVPDAAPLYWSYFLLFFALIVFARRLAGFGTIYLAAMTSVVTSITLNVLVPTSLVAQPIAPAGTLLALIQQFDTSLGAVPSGHVVLPAAMAVALALGGDAADAPRRLRLSLGFACWTLLLAAATLLTKQHYILDVVTGLIVGCAVAVAVTGTVRASQRAAIHGPTLRALGLEWAVITLAIMIAVRWWSVPAVLLAMLVIATRQHGLFILYHDGVHSLVARPQRLNDCIINTAVGVPLLLPVHLYRAVHLAHHRDVGTERDPERVLLYHRQPWQYRPIGLAPLALQVAGDTLLWNNIVMALRFFRARGDAQSPLRLARARAYPELGLQVALFVSAWIIGLVLAPRLTLQVALLWFLPYLTILQLLQKIRSFAEHAGEGEGDALTYSWAPGVIGRLIIWPYNINYHFEHHDRPSVPWNELAAMAPSARRRPGRELPALLWNGAIR